METLGRRARIRVVYTGVDITADIAGMVTSFSCTDNASGKADDLELVLEDRDGLWHGPWHPDQGAEVRAEIECLHFPDRGQSMAYPCGTYTVDEIKASGPPWSLTLRMVSSTVKKSLRREDKTRAWESMALSGIAGDIASAHGLSLFFEAPDVLYRRKDQRKESDLAFLSRLAEDAGLKLKVADRQLIIFSGKNFDAKDPVLLLTPQDLTSWRFTSQAHDVYASCRVDYFDPEIKEVSTYTFRPPTPPETGQTLKVNERVESLAAAERKARSKLREQNEGEVTGSMSMPGDPRIFAGNTLALTGFGAYAGTYFVKTCRHTYDRGRGYTTSADVRRTLDY